MRLLQAMATEEGFYKPGSRPARNLNPGDLEFNDESRRFGATHGDPRFAVFPSIEVGWQAFRRWLSVPAKFDVHGNLVGGYLGGTLEQVIGRFAPAKENDVAAYVRTVCHLTGLSPSTIVTAELLA